jgi:NADPH:quinone reductase-like Zn-dependent oxidoreductase
MKAVRFHDFGGEKVLVYEDVELPKIGPGEILIRLNAAALNHLDIFVRKGDRERKIPLPHIPGSDGAGVVVEVGSNVLGLTAGDRVLLYPGISCGECSYCSSGRENLCRHYRVLGTLEDGTYAEYVKVPARCAVPIPRLMNFNEAAAFPLVSLTAWHMLVTVARLQKGETVLVHGAGSGVGSAAIQVAKAFGVKVIATAGSDKKLEKAKALGADELINYQREDFAAKVRDLTEKRGVDVVFEHIGGEVFEKSLTVLAKGGRLVTCGATTNYSVQTDLRYIYFKHISVLGSIMGTRAELVEALALSEQGKLHAVIDSSFPLSQAAEAQRKLESRDVFGKIVLTI